MDHGTIIFAVFAIGSFIMVFFQLFGKALIANPSAQWKLFLFRCTSRNIPWEAFTGCRNLFQLAFHQAVVLKHRYSNPFKSEKSKPPLDRSASHSIWHCHAKIF